MTNLDIEELVTMLDNLETHLEALGIEGTIDLRRNRLRVVITYGDPIA